MKLTYFTLIFSIAISFLEQSIQDIKDFSLIEKSSSSTLIFQMKTKITGFF